MGLSWISRVVGLAAIAVALLAQQKNVYVVTHVDVTPNYTDDATKALKEFAADSKKDSGVVRFEVLQQDSRLNHYTIVEVWQSRDAFEKHSAAEHTKRFREKLAPMLGSPFDERLHLLLQ